VSERAERLAWGRAPCAEHRAAQGDARPAGARRRQFAMLRGASAPFAVLDSVIACLSYSRDTASASAVHWYCRVRVPRGPIPGIRQLDRCGAVLCRRRFAVLRHRLLRLGRLTDGPACARGQRARRRIPFSMLPLWFRSFVSGYGMPSGRAGRPLGAGDPPARRCDDSLRIRARRSRPPESAPPSRVLRRIQSAQQRSRAP